MSTSETDEYELGPCPCGNGHVVRSVTTQDNPWSGADISHRINCKACDPKWRLDGTSALWLTLRSSELPFEKARAAERRSFGALHDYLMSLGEKHLAAKQFSAKTKELEYLKQQNAYTGSYRDYLRARKSNSMAQVARYSQGSTFTTKLIQEYDNGTYEQLAQALASAESASEAARTGIVRKKVDPGS